VIDGASEVLKIGVVGLFVLVSIVLCFITYWQQFILDWIGGLQFIGSLKRAPHDWSRGRHDLAGRCGWICCDVTDFASISSTVAQKEGCQVSSSQHCTQRRLTKLTVKIFQWICNTYAIFSILYFDLTISCIPFVCIKFLKDYYTVFPQKTRKV